MMFRSAILAVVAIAVASGYSQAALAAPKKPAKSNSCFYSRDIDGFQAAGKDTVNIRVGIHDVYQLKLMGFSQDLDWTQRIALVNRGSSFICQALGTEVIVPGPSGPQRLPVQSMRKLTPAEVAALPKNQRP
jgi:hypothetical protein